MLLRSNPGSELLRSQGRCSSGAGARGGSCQERPSPTTQFVSSPLMPRKLKSSSPHREASFPTAFGSPFVLHGSPG